MKGLRIAAAVLYVAVIVAAARTERAPDHSAGRQIYVAGTAQSGRPVTASMAGGSELSAAMLPCANCHGADGRGTAEGGVVASNITWLELTKPYRAATSNGRRRPAYDERTLRRAVTEGVDSAGNPLHAAMPRYAMAADDLSDLVAYLKVLGGESTPGVTATSVRIGTVVPESPAGTQMAAVLSAYFKDAGEIHGRRVVLDVLSPAKVDAALQNDPPFALAGGLIAGIETPVEEAVERAAIPLVLPVSMRSDASAGNRQRFYLSPGFEEQLHALLRFRTASRVVVVTADDALSTMARRAAARLEKPPVLEIAATAAGVQQDPSTAIVFLDPDAALDGLSPGTSPLLFLGNLLPADFFKAAPSLGERVTVALTTTPGDLSAGGLAEFRAFAARHSIVPRDAAAQLSAYAAAQVVVHALKQSGRELTRDSFRAALESLYEFETGVTPPLTYGRSRRIAAPRVHLATMNARGDLAPIGTFNPAEH